MSYAKDGRFTAASQLLENMMASSPQIFGMPELEQVKARQDAILRAIIMREDVKGAIDLYIDSILELDEALQGDLNAE